ncbi:MAG: protein jag [Chloroflexi bacterium]|nr:protein jag [Chloroflexota bacterium]
MTNGGGRMVMDEMGEMDEMDEMDEEESIEVTGRTVDEAVQRALEQLGRRPEEVQISILSEGNRGLFGLGGEMARVLVAPVAGPARKPLGEDTARVAEEVLERLLQEMSVAAEVTVRQPAEADQTGSAGALDVSTEDAGVLIGRRGETLRALQFLINLIVAKRLNAWPNITVDVEGYRERREASLRGLAFRMADQVRATHQPMALEAMPAHERRIIHLALTDNPYVTTHSVGRDDERRVVIMPQRPSWSQEHGS